MSMLSFEIAGVTIELDSPMDWAEDRAFTPFLKHVTCPDYRVRFSEVETLPPIPEDVLHEDNCYRVHPDGHGGYVRSFFNAPSDLTAYSLARYDLQGGTVQIDFLPKGRVCVSELRNSFFHIGFEAMLIRKKRICLHASCVRTEYGGLLFSGVSGIGKSTQAELWCSYRGARQINGDRPVLSVSDRLLAWGSPYAGSSDCHVNESVPIRAIIMLAQSAECSLHRLSVVEAFHAVWQGVTMYSWDCDFVEEAYRLTVALLERVPVYKLACTPDERAVRLLESELRKEDRI